MTSTLMHPCLLVAATLLLCQACAQTVTQTVTLQPGWNAVWLEPQPADTRPGTVFAGLPVASVWMRTAKLEAAGFIQDQDEVPFNEPGWLLWLPPSKPDAAVLTSLFAINANRAYLIKVEGAAAATWVVTGTPVVRKLDWAPDGFSLVGLPVDPANPPTFQEFFRSSPAHGATATGQREPMYRLAADGRWTLLADTDRMRRGEACWVRTRGASDFTAPVEAFPRTATTLAFGPVLNQQRLLLANRTDAARSVTVRFSGLPAGVLARREWDPVAGFTWPDAPLTTSLSLGAQGSDFIDFAIRRAAMSAPLGTLLEVSDGAGTLFRIPVTAERLSTPAGAALAGRAPAGNTDAARPFRGLWVGTANVTRVAEVREDPEEVTPAKNPFPLRLIIHVDAAGRARLLKEVIQMWEDGTYRTLPGGRRVADQPGRYVLITDETLIGRFKGAGLRDGVEVGRRISTAGFEFDGGQENLLALAGVFAPTGRLTGQIVQAADSPTNPFKHRYHPDHDNLDVDFEPITDPARTESFAVSRDLEFEFLATDPGASPDPAYGYDVVAGVYREALTGLHKEVIRVQGTFRLRRLSESPDLNPQPRS